MIVFMSRGVFVDFGDVGHVTHCKKVSRADHVDDHEFSLCV